MKGRLPRMDWIHWGEALVRVGRLDRDGYSAVMTGCGFGYVSHSPSRLRAIEECKRQLRDAADQGNEMAARAGAHFGLQERGHVVGLAVCS